MTANYTNPDFFMYSKMKEWQEDFFNILIKESEFNAYNTIINLYYGYPAIIRIFIAAASYYVSNKILYKLSENKSVSSLVSEMGAMMQDRSIYVSPQEFITKYGIDVADRVYESLITWEGLDDEITLSNSYIHTKIHSMLTYLIKITGVAYCAHEVINAYGTEEISKDIIRNFEKFDELVTRATTSSASDSDRNLIKKGGALLHVISNRNNFIDSFKIS